jgi:hypothetical protein
MEVVGTIALLILATYLLTRRWLWVWALFLSALASLFAMIASIIHFQILGALGFFILSALLFSLTSFISER